MSLEKKKIAVITPFLANGGLEKVAVTGAKELEQHYDVTLIVFDTSQIDYPYDGKMIDLGIAFYDRNIFKRVFNLLRIIFKLREIKKHEAFDLIIVHGELANLAAVLTGKGNHIVMIHENRFAAIKDIQSKIFGMVSKQIYHAKNTKKIVTVSQGIKEKFIEHFDLDPNKMQTIYNPYDIATIQEKVKAPLQTYAELFERNVLISVGRLSEAKGHHYLLQIYHKLIESRSDTKLLVLGDGELGEALIVYAKELGLKVFSAFDDDVYSADYDVYFLGFHSNPYQYIAKAQLFVMSSLWEGFGNTIVESMACGTAVVSTDCQSGPREIIAPEEKQDVSEVVFAKYGVVTPAFTIVHHELSEHDKSEWCRAIVKLLGDTGTIEKYKKVGLQRANDFDKREIMAEWKELIDSSMGLEDKERRC